MYSPLDSFMINYLLHVFFIISYSIFVLPAVLTVFGSFNLACHVAEALRALVSVRFCSYLFLLRGLQLLDGPPNFLVFQ